MSRERKTPKAIDCLRNRWLGEWQATRTCPPKREACGPCERVPCETELFEAKQALIKLSQGDKAVEISEDGTRVRYQNSDFAMKCLKDRIRDLEMKCGDSYDDVIVSSCGPCGETVLEKTFVRTRPAPIGYNTNFYGE